MQEKPLCTQSEETEKVNIALLFGILSPASYADIIKNSKRGVQNAADALQKSFIEGLGGQNGDNDIEILNLPYIGSYPSLYKRVKLTNKYFEYHTQYGNIVKGKDIGFCNIVGVKNLFRYKNARRALKQWCECKSGQKVVIVYAIHSPFLKACVDVKRKFDKTLKIVLIVPDLPEYMSGSRNLLRETLSDFNQHLLNDLYTDLDAYVLLSQYMTERLPISDKPWTVIEGIFSKQMDCEESYSYTDDNYGKYILYTGTLAKRYGIMNLVEAFANTTNEQYKLVICGSGEASNEIKEFSQRDKRIIYRGLVERKDAIRLQRKASLLINPRTPEGEFTKYSFPSKTMEYMASGTPCIMYRLPGIPKEYFEYCYTIEELGVRALSERLIEIMSIPDSELKALGQKAQEFILQKKNPLVQTEKLVRLLKQI